MRRIPTTSNSLTNVVSNCLSTESDCMDMLLSGKCVLSLFISMSHLTVNLSAGLNGVEYMNTVHGASDTIDFPNFFGEAGNVVNFETERPALEVGDIVVMDNCPTYHFAGGEALQKLLSDCNIELVYTPIYLPDLNPTEFVFNKIKSVMALRPVGTHE